MSEQQQQQQQQQNFPCRLDSFLKYINFKLINEDELNCVVDYICGNLNAGYNFDYPYWYDMYSYTAKSHIVLRHRKKEGDIYPLVKLGECVCQDKVINFLKNSDKKCFCNNMCASVYFNKVF